MPRLIEDGMRVRRAVPGDEAVLRDVRLRALADAPDAFESTLEGERSRTMAEWSQRIERGATFILEDGGRVCGLVAGIAHSDDPTAAYLISMWVQPELRGTGAAAALIGAVLSWAEAEGKAAVVLDVGKTNERARGLYEKMGFRATGSEFIRERDGSVEVEMRRPLGSIG